LILTPGARERLLGMLLMGVRMDERLFFFTVTFFALASRNTNHCGASV
jgi:hypothetical protein